MTSPFETKNAYEHMCHPLDSDAIFGETSINRSSDWPFAEEYRGTYVVTHLVNQESFRRLFRGVFTSRFNCFVGNYTGSVFSQTRQITKLWTQIITFLYDNYESLKAKSNRLILYFSSWATPGYFHRGLLKDFVSDPTFYANQPC